MFQSPIFVWSMTYRLGVRNELSANSFSEGKMRERARKLSHGMRLRQSDVSFLQIFLR